MTKANDRAREKVRDAERRAKRKLARLRNKGIATRSINPIHPVDPTNTRALNSYAANLEKFISRKNAYVGINEGTPIPKTLWLKYKRTERTWNNFKRAQAERAKNRPYITTPGVQHDTTRSILEMMRKDAWKDAQLRNIKSKKELKERIKRLEHEMTKSFQIERGKRVRANVFEKIDYFDDKARARMIKALNRLTNEEMMILSAESNFESAFYSWINGDYSNKDMSTEEKDSAEISFAENVEGLVESIIRQRAPKRIPKRSERKKGKKKQRNKK